jgi:hypothetical protein
MSQDSQKEAPGFDDDVARVAALARKATRQAARAANRAGYFVEHAADACRVKSPGHAAITIPLKASTIDVNKRYAFADAAR